MTDDIVALEVAPKPDMNRGEKRAVLSGFARTAAADQRPVAVYLARFASKDGYRTQLSALKAAARAFSDGRSDDPHTLPWGELRYQHVVALRTKLVERHSPGTVNRFLSAVRGVAEEAMRLGQLDPGEYARIEAVKGVRGKRLPKGKHLDEENDLAPIFEGADSLKNATCAVRDRAILAVLRVSGLRRRELTDLRFEDLDWRSGKTKIIGKGDKERSVYLGGARAELTSWAQIRGAGPGPLFYAVHKHGAVIERKLTPGSIAFIVRRAADAGGVKGNVTPHDFRRSYVGDMLEEGIDVSTVQKLVGHASVTTTLQYDRRPDKVAEKAAETIKVPAKRRQ